MNQSSSTYFFVLYVRRSFTQALEYNRESEQFSLVWLTRMNLKIKSNGRRMGTSVVPLQFYFIFWHLFLFSKSMI